MTGFEVGDRILFMENLARIRQTPLRKQYEIDNDGLPWNEVQRVATALETFKAKRGLLDYTDMLTQFVAHDNDARLQKLFVDEAQDLSSLQWSVVDLLARSADRVVVAGDDDQAIYPWAGADVEHLIGMQGEARVLGQSYRCPPVIQKLSDKIIKQVAHRRPKKWRAKPGGDGEILQETSFANADISGQGSVLILARNVFIINKQIEPMLRAEGIIYERNGASSIKPSLLRAIVTWEDLRRERPVTVGEARRMYDYISTGAEGVRRGYKKRMEEHDDPDEGVSMRDLREHWGLAADSSQVWHEALDKLPQGDMSYMLAALRRGEKLRGETPRVRLSTIHSAKGGEADHVVLMKEMAERPYQEMHARPDDERRVFYVGVTRAREKLTVVASETHRECPWI
jgi:DNA helicase-2/ATP-dependent DNA helicase PcrA